MKHAVHRFVPVLLVVVLALASVSSASAESATEVDRAAPSQAAVVHNWEQTSIDTIYKPPAGMTPTPIPVGVLYLGFTSLAMYRAAQAAGYARASQVAAIAVAAHDVLVAYYPDTAGLDEKLAASLSSVPDGWAKQRGTAIGAFVAHRLIKSREDDGRNDTSIVYSKPPQPGIWQPQPAEMLAPWLGFVDPLVLRAGIKVDGPDPINSMAYAFDYQEVKRIGAKDGADRTQSQTDTALFFNSNSAIMVSEALLDYLNENPLGLRETARLFAVAHSAMADAIITCWRLKYEVGFWRPNQAIQGAASDGNPATIPDTSWEPLLPTPPYSDYVSGHGCLTGPAIQAIRNTLGEETALTLHSYPTNSDKPYPNLSSIEFDTFHARIWGGLHFRDAMEDAYYIGHEAADRVQRQLR